MSDNDTLIDDHAIAALPEILYHAEADAIYGPVVGGLGENLAFEREMEELADKMVQEVSVMFDDDGIELDFSDDSLEQLDTLVKQVWDQERPEDPDVLDAIVANWGAYLGNCLMGNMGGRWHFRSDIEHASVYFPRTTMEVFPMHKVRKRFRLGEGDSLFTFYEAILDELDKA